MIFGSADFTEIVVWLSLLAGIAVAVLAFIFIVPDKKRPQLNGIGKFFHDLCNFKFLIIEKIFQFVYIVLTVWVIIYGFFTLFSFTQDYNYDYYYGYSYSNTEWVGYYGFLIMILGPIGIRIGYELMMLTIIAIKNIIQINNKLKNQNEGSEESSPFANPSVSDYAAPKPAPQAVYGAPAPAQAPAGGFCSNCGSPKPANGICPNCGQ